MSSNLFKVNPPTAYMIIDKQNKSYDQLVNEIEDRIRAAFTKELEGIRGIISEEGFEEVERQSMIEQDKIIKVLTAQVKGSLVEIV